MRVYLMGSALGVWLRRWRQVIVLALAVVAPISYTLYFVHLRADFPDFSPWDDRSKLTDEGWYASATVHHFVFNHWYMPGAFNPAVPMPVWSAFAYVWFLLTGFGIVQLRILSVLVCGASMLFVWQLVRKQAGVTAATLTVALLVVNPFFYSFNRLAVLEPLIVFWMLLAWILAGWAATSRHAIAPILLGLSVTSLLLTKATGAFLIPSILYYFLCVGAASRNVVKSAWIAILSMCVSFGAYQICIRPFQADSDLLFRINNYHIHLSIASRFFLLTLRDGMWIHPILFPLACLCLLLAAFFWRDMWRMPLFGAAVIAAIGYGSFILYHGNLQPRYYLVLAPSISIVIVLTLQRLLQGTAPISQIGALTMVGTLAATLVTMAVRTVQYAVHPQYSFLSAMLEIQSVIRKEPDPMVISTLGDDISLFTGIPSICDEYSTVPSSQLLQRYHPGWYAVMPDSKTPRIVPAIKARYRMEEHAHYIIFDDPSHNVLVLYRLLPLAGN